MPGRVQRISPWFTGLSARLLVLTIAFVMLGEVLIYAPSIARFRITYMEERIAAAHLASLALQVPPDNVLSNQMRRELLDHAQSHAIVLRRPHSKAMILDADMPPQVDALYDLRQGNFVELIGEALMVLVHNDNRFLRVVSASPKDPAVTIETVIEEAPMRRAMIDYSNRILALSIVISLMTAGLVYFSLQWLMVMPMQRITDSMVAFRNDPEDARHVMAPSRRSDEIGTAQRELAHMQERLRGALMQRARLAALGGAMAKINHDLRNILATAQLVSDRVSGSDDPKVKRVAPTLLGAIDRAVTLCSQTLDFAASESPAPDRQPFDLSVLVDDVFADLRTSADNGVALDNGIEMGFRIDADRHQMFRVLSNLARNAYQAGAKRIGVSARRDDGDVLIEIADNGPGLPPKVRERLFQPFAGAGRPGGAGLGLSIARDLMRGHGGDITLAETGENGTVFRLRLPPSPAAGNGRRGAAKRA